MSSLKGVEYNALTGTGTLESLIFLISCIAPPDGINVGPNRICYNQFLWCFKRDNNHNHNLVENRINVIQKIFF